MDESAKTITFCEKHDVDSRFFCSQIEAQKANDQRHAGECPEGQLSQLSKKWFESVRFSNHGLHFDDATISRSGAVDVAVEWMARTCLPELPPTTMLAGCCIGDVRRILATLYVYSLFVTRLEDVADDHPIRGVALEPRLVSGTKNDLIRWLANLSKVGETNVEAIVALLTFDVSHPHVTVAQQPFVSSRDGFLFLLPRLITGISLKLPRMFISAANRSSTGQKDYSRIVHDAGLKALANQIRRAVPQSFQIVVDKEFQVSDGSSIKPDIVIFANNDEVLAIDAKYATPPFGPLDIRYDIKETEEKWKPQVNGYVKAFQQHPEILTQHFPSAVDSDVTVYGMILLRWPFPIPVEFQRPIFAIDWPSLKDYLEKVQTKSISELADWISSRPDLPVLETLAWKQKEIKVADWTYRYSVLAPSPPSNNEKE